MIKVLVDGNCKVCDWEISKYKRMRPEAIELVDISDDSFDAAAFGLDATAVNRRMHVIAEDGTVRVGVAAFAEIWRQIPKLRPAARAIAWPGLRHLAALGYEAFAVVRPWLPKKRRIAAS